jgi:HEAT repeat protein
MTRNLGRGAVTALAAASASVRHTALVTLGKLNKAALSPHAPAIACVLADPDEWVRAEAVMTLGKLEHEELAPYVAAIVPLLGDSGAAVRYAAAVILGNMEPAERILHERAIVRFLLYDDADVVHGMRNSAVVALGGLDALLSSGHTVGLLVDAINGSVEFAKWKMNKRADPRRRTRASQIT